MPPDVAPQGFEFIFTQGPLGAIIGILLWYIGILHRERKDERDAHKIEIAAERSLNAQLQKDRIEDHKVLIPLTTSLVTAVEIQKNK